MRHPGFNLQDRRESCQVLRSGGSRVGVVSSKAKLPPSPCRSCEPSAGRSRLSGSGFVSLELDVEPFSTFSIGVFVCHHIVASHLVMVVEACCRCWVRKPPQDGFGHNLDLEQGHHRNAGGVSCAARKIVVDALCSLARCTWPMHASSGEPLIH